MTDSIKHYLFTRFNVASPGKEQPIRLKPGWLDKRFDLFRDLCLPGVKSQTVQSFEWIVLFDEETPQDYKNLIGALQTLYPFTAEYTKAYEMDKMAPEIIHRKGDKKEGWLLTTRLDSDDVLAVDFMERVYEAIKPLKRQTVNFANGAILGLSEKATGLYTTRDLSNPFGSLLEPYTDDIVTIWEKQHIYYKDIAPVMQIEGVPGWLQVVHGVNATNRIKGLRIPLSRYADVFPYIKTLSAVQSEKKQDITLENFTLIPLRYLYEVARASAKAIVFFFRGLLKKI